MELSVRQQPSNCRGIGRWEERLRSEHQALNHVSKALTLERRRRSCLLRVSVMLAGKVCVELVAVLLLSCAYCHVLVSDVSAISRALQSQDFFHTLALLHAALQMFPADVRL